IKTFFSIDEVLRNRNSFF
ncbi:hypothetical protein CP8484711_2336B, partial [Chlamydia psittaci 84-8471/1]